ncbi:unnamed protein product [Lactuca virosa]|uniref:Uncharacterized protein n=1 Tax=Lactuca virosa TaxID=75947 RepID=A0AAU9PT35_9ASTR|nr:unnamed protein product [Lactuca virosa]
MAHYYFFLCTLLTLSLSFYGTSAVNYQVTNFAEKTPGGIRFTKEIGIPFTKTLMGTINNYIWTTILQQSDPADRKPVPTVNIYIVDFKGAEAITWGDNINGKAPTGLVEGVADYTILKANYFPPAFAKPGTGNKWDQGYDFTARFLEYCDGITPGFVAKLNKKMRKTFDVKFFQELTGKPLDTLWKNYKAKYGNIKHGDDITEFVN